MHCGPCLIATLLGVTMPSSALAHALGIECSLKKGIVHVEAYFDDDTTPNQAKVEVFDSHENLVAHGKTDPRGQWSFPAPLPGTYRVAVDAGAGHRAETTIRIPEDGDQRTPVSTAKEDEGKRISEGQAREEFTRFPWLKLGLGVGALLVFSVAFLVARRR